MEKAATYGYGDHRNMRNHNSQDIDFYVEMLVSIYHDMVGAILPQHEIDRDTEEIRSRSRNEGMHFLTKVLPALGKSIDVSLAKATPLEFKQFKVAVGTRLPRFMLSILRVVFRDDGVPWFATWYSDLCACPVNGHVEMDWTEVQWKLVACAFADAKMMEVTRAQALVHRRQLDARSLLGSGFPGSHNLAEVGLSPEERAHIMLGLTLDNSPLRSDAELNSRREAMVVALKALRQVCYSLYKLKLPYSDEQKSRVLEDFVRVDKQLDFSVQMLDSYHQIVHKEARRIICRVLANADPLAGIPRHGPGAVATGEKSPAKHVFARYYERLNAFFKYDEWFFCNGSHVCDSYSELQAFDALECGTAKVVLVPKDSRGPRLISAEPLEYQWIQQALMRVLVDTIERHPLSSGQVNFTYQSVNRNLALRGSKDNSFVTLDMKEASDRVSMELVRTLFPTRWWDALYASRSAATQLPDGRVVQLRKFAPMGSAVCFPVESLVFWAISVSVLMTTYNLSLREATAKVYVYGDDIIVDAIYHRALITSLPQFGLMLNDGKCCTAGPFKESCGMDAFYGHPVTPTRISSVWCQHPEPSMLASYVEYSNAFYRDGMFESAFYLEREVQWVLRSHRMDPIPTVSSGSPSCIAFVRPNERPIPKNRALGCKIRRRRSDALKPDYQRHEVRGYRLESKPVMAQTYGWPFLLRKLTEMEAKTQYRQLDEPGASSLPTGQYPIAHRVRLKRAWTPLV